MSDFTFTPDDRGIEDVLNGPGMAQHLNGAAGAIAGAVKNRGPRRRASFFEYRSGVSVMPATFTRSEGLVAAVVADSPGWHLAEFGTTEVSALAPLRRGARDVSGVRFIEGDR